jgi:2-amino-4-hydroxy-6-hydroxymethyldihydropteridine diphosphokinase
VTRAFLSLGSNLGDRAGYLRAALGAIGRGPRTELRGVSKVYETVPVEVEDEQPDYLNCVLEVECGVSAVELLRFCQGVEAALGREGKGERGPRTVDVDVLLFGDEEQDTRDLVLPHGGILRAFNLAGLADLDAEAYIPRYGRVGTLLQSADLGGVRTFAEGI